MLSFWCVMFFLETVSIPLPAGSVPAVRVGVEGARGLQSPASLQAPGAIESGSGSDACRVLPGSEVVRLVGGFLVEERLIADAESTVTRCVYLTAGGKGEKAFVFWLMPAQDYPGLKEAMEEPIREIENLGDEAFIVYHQEDARFDLFVLDRGKATIEITGADEEDVRTLAGAALKGLGFRDREVRP